MFAKLHACVRQLGWVPEIFAWQISAILTDLGTNSLTTQQFAVLLLWRNKFLFFIASASFWSGFLVRNIILRAIILLPWSYFFRLLLSCRHFALGCDRSKIWHWLLPLMSNIDASGALQANLPLMPTPIWFFFLIRIHRAFSAFLRHGCYGDSLRELPARVMILKAVAGTCIAALVEARTQELFVVALNQCHCLFLTLLHDGAHSYWFVNVTNHRWRWIRRFREKLG